MSKQHASSDTARNSERGHISDGHGQETSSLRTSLQHLSPVERDEWGIGVIVDEAGRYAELDFDIPSGLPLSEHARMRLEAARAKHIEYTDHTDREYETFFDFPATEWVWAAPFVHRVRDARGTARREIIQELRRVALDYLAGTVKEGSVDADAVHLLRRMMLRDQA